VRVVLVAACSLDGKIANTARDPVTFTSRADREHLFQLRDEADAILVGAGTIRAEDPPLLPDAAHSRARAEAGMRPYPVRAVVSRSLDLPLTGRALAPQKQAPVIVFTTDTAPEGKRAALEAVGHEVVTAGRDRVDVLRVLAHLTERQGVERVSLEGGGELNAAALASNLVDEVWLTVCPVLIGGADAPTPVDGPGLLGGPRKARLIEHRMEDGEVFLHYALQP
jgi:riboflavin-specific deaminase-like protein